MEKTKAKVLYSKKFVSEKGNEEERKAELQQWKEGMEDLLLNVNPSVKAAFIWHRDNVSMTMMVFSSTEDMLLELGLISETLEEQGMFINVEILG